MIFGEVDLVAAAGSKRPLASAVLLAVLEVALVAAAVSIRPLAGAVLLAVLEAELDLSYFHSHMWHARVCHMWVEALVSLVSRTQLRCDSRLGNSRASRLGHHDAPS